MHSHAAPSAPIPRLGKSQDGRRCDARVVSGPPTSIGRRIARPSRSLEVRPGEPELPDQDPPPLPTPLGSAEPTPSTGRGKFRHSGTERHRRTTSGRWPGRPLPRRGRRTSPPTSRARPRRLSRVPARQGPTPRRRAPSAAWRPQSPGRRSSRCPGPRRGSPRT